ncbi:MAG: DUF4158 domain-containing protein, partial [Acidobacteriota bacterium]|nr:DUF4158 domain-containing protein [Acidobacteriota bacterium]
SRPCSLGADAETIHAYARRQLTVSEHQQRIGEYLRLRTFDTAACERLARFLEDEAQRLDRTASLLGRGGSPRPGGAGVFEATGRPRAAAGGCSLGWGAGWPARRRVRASAFSPCV